MDFTTTDENQATLRSRTCQTSGGDIFSHDNISACERYVLSIQRRLDKAVANDDKPQDQMVFTYLDEEVKSRKKSLPFIEFVR